MSAENRFLRYARATIAGTLLASAVDLPFIAQLATKGLAFELQNAQATEFYRTNEQILQFTPELSSAIADLESGDINLVMPHLVNSFSWGIYPDSSPQPISRQDMLNLYSASFRTGRPGCLGYFNAGRSQLGVVMLGLRAKTAAPGSLVVFGIGTSGISFSSVKELTQQNITTMVMSSDFAPCVSPRARPTVVSKEVPTPIPRPTPLPTARPITIDAVGIEALPEELKNTRIAFMSTKDGNENVYTETIGGTNAIKITDDNRSKRDLRPLPNGNIVYSSLGVKGEDKSKLQVVNLDVNAKKENIVWTGTSDEGIPFCPSGTGKNIYWSSHELIGSGNLSENIWSSGDEGSNVHRVTSDNEGNSEHCPVVSLDGHVAFNVNTPGSHGGRPGEIAIYPNIDTLSKDFDAKNLPKLINGDLPVGWTPDSEWLLFTRQENETSNLYKIRIDGSRETKIMDRVWNASISPDGKYVLVYASQTDSANGKFYVVSSEGGRPIKLAENFGKVLYPTWLVEKPRITRNVVAVLQGIDSAVIDSRKPDGLTRELFRALTDLNYDPLHDFGLLSVTGGHIINGFWVPNKQSCSDTYRDPETLGLSIAIDIKKILDSDPNLQITAVGHSFGGTILANAMEAIESGQVNADQSRIKIIVVDSPIQGVSKPFFEQLGVLFMNQMDRGCELIGGIPNPDYLNTPAGQVLLDMWDNRSQTQARWNKAATGFQAKGGKVYALGNIQDCVMSIEVCGSGLDFEMRIFVNLFWRSFPVITQEMPGALNTWRALGILGFGHDRYFTDFEFDGLSTLVSVIGPQIGNNK